MLMTAEKNHRGGSHMETEKDQGLESGWAGPGIEIWPDDHAEWVMRHRNAKRALETSIPEIASSPIGGQGYHNG
jgi:hypothetical protein